MKKTIMKKENMTKKDQDKQNILNFLLGLAQEQGDKEKYFRLGDRFKGVLDEKKLKCLVEVWGD